MDDPTVATRHLANLAGAIAEAAFDEGRKIERFDSMHGPVTVVVDDRAVDVAFHDRDVSVHVRLDSDTDKDR
jgi:hypothetical protein